MKNALGAHGLITVRMPGGTLRVEDRLDWSIRLQGAVEEVCTGALSPDLVAALAALRPRAPARPA